MAVKSRMTIENRFPAAKEGCYEMAQAARELWMEVGQETAQSKLDQQAATRGYNLAIGIGKEKLGYQSARIFAAAHSAKWGDDPFWTRFFEYGTVAIPAMPFIRPGSRKANKAYVAAWEGRFEGFIRRKPFKVKEV